MIEDVCEVIVVVIAFGSTHAVNGITDLSSEEVNKGIRKSSRISRVYYLVSPSNLLIAATALNPS